MLPWATENAVAGHMWPMVCHLSTSGLAYDKIFIKKVPG